jgi:hypothetical protein
MSYARQCLMVTHADAGSIPARSTNPITALLIHMAEITSAGLNWFRRVRLMVGSSCRKWTLSISVYQTKNAMRMLAKAVSFVKSLFTMPNFGMEAAASMA